LGGSVASLVDFLLAPDRGYLAELSHATHRKAQLVILLQDAQEQDRAVATLEIRCQRRRNGLAWRPVHLLLGP
jgi:hypothetical protein